MTRINNIAGLVTQDTSRWPIKPWQIISLRQRLGKTQIEFARMISADPSTVGRWESGRSCPRRIYVRLIMKIMQEHYPAMKSVSHGA